MSTQGDVPGSPHPRSGNLQPQLGVHDKFPYDTGVEHIFPHPLVRYIIMYRIA
jgi:hypothetical protein